MTSYKIKRRHFPEGRFISITHFPTVFNTQTPSSIYIIFLRKFFVVRVPQSVQRPATGWTVRGSNLGGGRYFPHLSRPALGHTQPPVKWVLGLSRGKERPERDADPSPLLLLWSRKGRAISLFPLRGPRACTEPQCRYKGALYLLLLKLIHCKNSVLSEIDFTEIYTSISNYVASLEIRLLDFKLSRCCDCLYSFFWVIPRRLNFICRRFGTLSLPSSYAV